MDNGLRACPDACVGCAKWGAGGCSISDWKDVPVDRSGRCKAQQENEKALAKLQPSDAQLDAWVEEQAKKAGMA